MVTVSEPQADKNVVILRGMLLFNCIESEAAGHYGCHVISDNFVRSEEFDIAVQSEYLKLCLELYKHSAFTISSF